MLKLTADEHDALLTLTAEPAWKLFIKKLPELSAYIEESFKRSEISPDQLLYTRGKVDGAEEFKRTIEDFSDYIRSQDYGTKE